MVAACFSAVFRVIAAYIALTIASVPHALSAIRTVKNIGKQMLLRCGNVLASELQKLLNSFEIFAEYVRFMGVL